MSRDDAGERDKAPSGLHMTTLEGVSGVKRDPLAPVPVLTVLYHAFADRVGEQAVLSDLWYARERHVSRLEPEFQAPGAARGEPLADPFLSRKPTLIKRAPKDALLVVPAPGLEVHVDGTRARGETLCSAESLARGVVIDLAGRIVLLLRVAPRPPERPDRLGLVGENEAMERLRADILRVADLDVPVMIRGESGTGKELVSRAIHKASKRSRRACLSVNMGAIPPTMAGSELFGHVRGAFTGAVRDHEGHFARADGGTLFLDEVGEMAPEVQVMLLRAIETHEVQPIGAPRARKVDVRLVTATDADLEQATHDGRFKLPLLHRLAGYVLTLPPLRERRDDIGRLVVHFLREELEEVGEAHRLRPKSPQDPPWIPPELMARLALYDWPGNVRQLRNVVRQLVISSRGQPTLRADPYVEKLLSEPLPAKGAPQTKTGDSIAPGERKAPGELTDAEVLVALEANAYRLGPTAKQLGVSRPTLYAIIDRSSTLRRAKDLEADEIERAKAEAAGDLSAMVAILKVSRRGLQIRMKELGVD